MAKAKKITLVDGDDWNGLYIDGVLIYENHRITAEEVLKYCGIPFDGFECDFEWLGSQGHFPEELKDVKRG